MTDPRVDFARRLRALQEATGLSIRRLEVESERTPRRRNEDRIRLKRSTIAGMINRERPVRPQLANFEVFVDTCLRVAAENGISLPPELGNRESWDEAYRELRDHVDRYPRGSAVPEQPPVVEESKPSLTRRNVLLAMPAVLAVAAAAVAVPLWLRGSRTASTEMPDDDTYGSLGRLLSAPIAKDDPVWSVAVGTLNGEPLAVVGRADGTVQLWNPITGRARTHPLAAHDQPIYSIALDAPTAVSASVDGTLRLWDLTTDPPTSARMGDQLTAGVNSVALGVVNGRKVAVSAGDDRTVRLWDLATPTVTGTVLGDRLDTEVKSIAVGSVKGKTVAVSGSDDGSIRLWDLAAGTGRLIGAHQTTVGTVAIGAARNRILAVSGSEDGIVRTWDLTADEPAGTVLGDTMHTAVKTVATGTIKGTTVAISGSDDNIIRIWDLTTGHPYGNGLTGPNKGSESLAIGNFDAHALVVSGHWDGTIWAWSL
ncbi:WD40 repeat domain-containing protein [Kutzneria kofuensis]|uniref:WD40 repeat protein n=1 Tax=Kutzneria kofuensis TaxID=103725 RepID=A0A7W9NFJ5_9PSEU|nr:hypothetical protein [Kutzneria kofuensis]MBB5890589.1 hypothetical protein [Kutzneria kofuensis]